MIIRLKIQNKFDVYDFVSRIRDKYEDFYVTKNKERKFLNNNWAIIENILKYQEVYGIIDKDLRGIIVIVRDKGFRPYVKILAENSKYTIDLLKFLKWNFVEQLLFFKLKKNNPLSSMIIKTGFIKIGDRGSEYLFEKKAIKQLYKITPKDEYLKDDKNRLY